MSGGRERARLVGAARRDIALGSRSFALASRLFDRAIRERVWLLYAWCRAADDIVDGQVLGMARTVVPDPVAALATVRGLTDRALRGERTGRDAFDALGIVVAECGIPPRLVHDVIDGFALDSVGFSPEREDDLYRYCYHVAGAVGVMMAIVMGVDRGRRDVLDRACDQGMAFQLANIARDIGEDARVGRCYIPHEWLAEDGLGADRLPDMAAGPALARIARRLAGKVADYERSARVGAASLPFRSRWAVLAAAGIYGGIARTVVRRGAAAWDSRTATTATAKLGWVVAAGAQALGRRAGADGADRAGLWTRPARD